MGHRELSGEKTTGTGGVPERSSDGQIKLGSRCDHASGEVMRF